MKRLLSILLSVMLLLSLAACGQTNTDSAISEPIESTAGSEERESNPASESVPNLEGDMENEVASESEGDTVTAPEKATKSGSNILIAYFSWSGNTRQVAQEIQQQTNGNLFELTLVDPYPEDYNETGERWRREQSENARPELASKVENMDDYGIVFLGYPIWSSTLPSPNRTFLEQYDFSGKTIIPFCTHGGSRFGSSVSVIEELAPGATIAEGYETSGRSAGNCTDEVTHWLQELGIIE